MKNLNKRKFAFFASGGIEIRTYFTKELSILHNNSVLYHVFNDVSFLEDYQNKFPINVQQINKSDWKKVIKVERVFLSVFRARERLKGDGSFKLYGEVKKKIRKKDFLIGNEFVYRLIKWLIKFINMRYENKEVIHRFNKDKITDLLLCGYLTSEVMTIAYSAKACNINIWSIVHSWKDVYINGQIPFDLNGLFVWNKSMKLEYLKRNYGLKSEQVHIIGNPRMEQFRSANPYRNIDYYTNKYRFSDHKIKILYTCINPKIISNEEMRILEIYNALKKMLDMPFEILVKINPMDSDILRWQKLSSNTDIYILENNWIWDSQNDINYPSYEAEIEWMDLLYYSDMTMNIASTVSIESLLMNTPVLNIAFDEYWQKCLKSVELSQSPFYITLLSHKHVDLIFSKKELIEKVKALINSKNSFERYDMNDTVVKWNQKLFKNILEI